MESVWEGTDGAWNSEVVTSPTHEGGTGLFVRRAWGQKLGRSGGTSSRHLNPR